LESSLDMEIDRPAPRTRTTATARTPVGRADIDTAPVGRSRGERSEASSASRYDRAPVSTGERYLYWFYCVGVRDMNVLWIERGRSQKRILGRIDMQVRNHHHRLDMNVVRGWGILIMRGLLGALIIGLVRGNLLDLKHQWYPLLVGQEGQAQLKKPNQELRLGWMKLDLEGQVWLKRLDRPGILVWWMSLDLGDPVDLMK
jgi:hypothetical protein